MNSFSITILGCRVNHYEAEQIAMVLRSRGLIQVDAPAGDVRVVHTCSVTSMAAKGSRQAVRRATRLTVLGQSDDEPAIDKQPDARVIVTGCWATSDRDAAEKLPGVDAVITHHDDVNAELTKLLDAWEHRSTTKDSRDTKTGISDASLPGALGIFGGSTPPRGAHGTTSLPLLDHHQDTHQRAFLKIQDGCDAHCTYCIIPQLRPTLWSKSPDDAVLEAQQLVAAGHQELVLTGIFLGAYGQPTALRRRQSQSTSKPLAELIDALCTRVPGLVRLRLSSLEPGDLDDMLIQSLRRHAQVVPHFHLPLQSGSDAILRRMNRQYTRSQFLDMVGQVNDAFDRPAITTDIIAGFPGETEEEFAHTLDVVERARFTHVHAFTYSARPNTAAARWKEKAIDHATANQRMKILHDRAADHARTFAQQFIGETVTLLVERGTLRHGRSERYFDVYFDADENIRTGDLVRVCIDRVTPARIHGSFIEVVEKIAKELVPA